MELQPNLVINKDFYEIAVVCQDNLATVVTNRNKILQTQMQEIDIFLRDELVPIVEYPETMEYEVRNEQNEVVLPFKIQAKTLWLCPFFFGKKWSLWSGKSFIVDLNVQLYLKLRGWEPLVH